MELTNLNGILVLHLLIGIMVGWYAMASSEISAPEGIDPQSLVFFLPTDLKIGKKMLLYFPDREGIRSPSSPPLLSKGDAEKIPFSTKRLPEVLQDLSFLKGSPEAIAMEETLRYCELEPIKGEVKICATSVEAMMDFAEDTFRKSTRLKNISTRYVTKLTSTLQRYTITALPQQILAQKLVSCHSMPYAYAVFYCHYLPQNRAYMVNLVAHEGDHIEALAICHMNTSNFIPTHVSFRVLGVEPLVSPVCHFFPADDLVFVPDYSTKGVSDAY